MQLITPSYHCRDHFMLLKQFPYGSPLFKITYLMARLEVEQLSRNLPFKFDLQDLETIIVIQKIKS